MINVLKAENRRFLLAAIDKAEALLKESVGGQVTQRFQEFARDKVNLKFTPVLKIDEKQPLFEIMVPVPEDRKRYAWAILKIVCDVHGLDQSEVLAKGKREPVALCRHMAIGLMSEKTFLSYKKIGFLVGNRDHATAMHSDEENYNLCFVNKKYSNQYNKCKAEAEKLENTLIRMEKAYITKADLVDNQEKL